jgi:RNA polymerase sigma factor (sigma-70 family)
MARQQAPFSPPNAGAMLGWPPRLRLYARALRSNREDADDLVQDTLERVWSRAGLWQGVGDMRTWLSSSMHDLHVDALRRGCLDMVALDEHILEIPIAATLAERLALRDLQKALVALPMEQYQVLLLVAVESKAYADIARALDIPIGTVMSRLSRGRERLRGLMAGDRASRGRGIAPRPERARRVGHDGPRHRVFWSQHEPPVPAFVATVLLGLRLASQALDGITDPWGDFLARTSRPTTPTSRPRRCPSPPALPCCWAGWGCWPCCAGVSQIREAASARGLR